MGRGLTPKIIKVDKEMVQKLNDILRPDENRFNIPKSSELDAFSQDTISALCVHYGMYLVPTVELVEYLQNIIDPADTIEVGSGCGLLGTALGIRMTDNRMQERPEIQEYLRAAKQRPVQYHPDVEKIDAVSAVKKYEPKTVLAAWVSDPQSGNMYGPREVEFFDTPSVERYILIGHERVHSNKEILGTKFFKKKIKPKWLVSRSARKGNTIYIFERNGKG